MVQDELTILPPEAKVFKLLGPALLRNELDEAKANVKNRLEFIQNQV